MRSAASVVTNKRFDRTKFLTNNSPEKRGYVTFVFFFFLAIADRTMSIDVEYESTGEDN